MNDREFCERLEALHNEAQKSDDANVRMGGSNLLFIAAMTAAESNHLLATYLVPVADEILARLGQETP